MVIREVQNTGREKEERSGYEATVFLIQKELILPLEVDKYHEEEGRGQFIRKIP